MTVTKFQLEKLFPNHNVTFQENNSLLVFHYEANHLDEKGYPIGVSVSFDQIESLHNLNEGKEVEFALCGKDFIYQIKLYIETQYFRRDLPYVKELFKDFSYCTFNNVLSKTIECGGIFKKLFTSSSILNLGDKLDTNQINVKFVCYKLGYY